MSDSDSPLHRPRFPIYIPTKSRAADKLRLTVQSLERMNVPFHAIVEQQQYEAYAAVMDKERLLILDPSYQRDYDTFDDLGDSKSKGPGAARNFAWDHAVALGHEWHWVMDDNIRCFQVLHRNRIARAGSGMFFRCLEDWVLRYENIGMAGPNYQMFVPRKAPVPAYVLNTRIYSCNLIRNALPYRWRGRYNEDTDLSLRMLKAGWVTVQFNALLQEKMPTQSLRGGNSKEFYDHEGTMAKSKMQVAMHPDCSRLTWRFGRVHHHVDYTRFKGIGLVRRPDAAPLPLYQWKIVDLDRPFNST